MSHRDSLAALRHGEFRALLGGSFLFTIAIQIQEVALGYELYRITRSPLVLGLIGLALALPFMTTALFGGHIADRRDRRGIALTTLGCIVLGSVTLWWIMRPEHVARMSQTTLLGVIYGVIMLLGLARGFLTPAVTALRGVLVPRELYANATAWSTTGWQAGAILGPAAGGFLVAGIGLSSTLAVVTTSFVCAWTMFWLFVRPRPVDRRQLPSHSVWHSLREGIAYVWQTRLILHSITLDMLSVLFGGVVAILPVFAMDILDVGAEGLGLLRAASAFGAIVTVLICTRHPPTGRPWRNLLIATLGFSLSTLVFGLSPWFWLSLLALFSAGAFDSIGVVIRGTVLQSLAPDHLRGRVLAVNSVFIVSSNELGAFESGLAAQYLGAVRSVVAGSLLSVIIITTMWTRTRELFDQRL